MKKFIIKISVIFFVVASIASLVIMINRDFTRGKGYGPGAYYYSDIPGWEGIFY